MKSSRLTFLGMAVASVLVACATSAPEGVTGDDDVVPDGTVAGAPLPSVAAGDRLRLVAGNITSGNRQAYEQPGIRIFRGLDVDIAMIQEFNTATNATAELRNFVDQAFGPEFQFARGAASQQIPNGIVSRYPILASGEWLDSSVGNRAFTWAQIDIPGAIDLYAISVHLLSSSSGSRNTEAGQLVQNIRTLPANAYVVLGGDFNTTSRSEACVQTLSSVLTTTAPFPVDEAGQGNTNANRNKPYDWVLANSALDALETPVVIGAHTFPSGFVADTRVYSAIGELAPALSSDSGASNMQHMAVVRDFVLPDAPPPPPPVSVQVTSPNGGTSVDLSGWTISDATAVRHVFAAGTTLGAGRAIVVFAGASAIPGGLTNAIASSTGSFVFGNSGDTVKLGSPAGLVDSVTYTSALSGTDGVSMNRSPDGSATGTFVLHTTLSSAPRSAGTRVTGAAF